MDWSIDGWIVSGGSDSDSARETWTRFRRTMSSDSVSASDRTWSADDAGRNIELGPTYRDPTNNQARPLKLSERSFYQRYFDFCN